MKDIFVDEKNRLIIIERSRERFTDDGGHFGASKLSSETLTREKVGKKELKSIKLNGTWKLTETQDLEFNLSGSDSRFFGKSIVFRGRFIRFDGSNLSFRIRKSDTLSGLRTKNIRLNGAWKADKKNRLSFVLSKSSGRYDILTFQGKWDTGANNYITYRLRETIQKSGIKREHELVLKGWWQIRADRLVYRLYLEKPGEIVFNAALQSHSLRAKEGKIRYQIGIQVEDKRRLRTERIDLTIYGRWKFNRDMTVGFWVKFGGKILESVRFEAEKIFAAGNTVKFSLRTTSKDFSPELEIIFKREVIPDVSLFLALSRFSKENSIRGGITIKF